MSICLRLCLNNKNTGNVVFKAWHTQNPISQANWLENRYTGLLAVGSCFVKENLPPRRTVTIFHAVGLTCKIVYAML